MNTTKRKERLLDELRRMGIEKEVLDALDQIDRRIFVPEPYRKDAYANYPQPIGHGQTISQPYTVAYMIQLLDLHEGQSVLEIGAGSGYNAAVMSKLVGKEGGIVSVELVSTLAETAKINLRAAEIENVKIVQGDGYEGYPPDSPYDRIIVTAGASEIPDPLMTQLKQKGIMVIPVSVDGYQVMTRILKDDPPKITQHGEFRFVPFR
ncbi:protein-L-isoaspartate(D-aspartate) O-methyltransferase [Candidatus Thorarchaeota archaeon]|nr:MAG: protein-L-isoaspartate(D-aspartate) O-methyltransferase [Candidatus Thorarchaeota archaeon]